MALPAPCAARFHDGLTAAEHPVTVRVDPQRMVLGITGDSLPGPLDWPLSDLRALRGRQPQDTLVLTRHAETEDERPRDPARLVIDDPAMRAWLRRTRPALHHHDLRKGTLKRLGVTALSACAAVLILLFVILPAMANTLARLLPLEREVALGRAVTGQMERMLGSDEEPALTCTEPAGRVALDALTARLTADQPIAYALDVRVLDHEMVNAFAAPGGQVVLLRGLLEQAPGPDAVAAVLAHEIGHVVARDPTRLALRSVGSAGLLSLVVGDVTGGALVVFLGDQLLNTSYTREAEAAADGFALARLDAARISAAGMGAFFDTMADLRGGAGLPEILSSHPDTGGRAMRARDFAAAQAETFPALSDAEWAALQAICD